MAKDIGIVSRSHRSRLLCSQHSCRRENGKVAQLGFIPFFHAAGCDSSASIQLTKPPGVSIRLLANFSDTDAAHTMKLVDLNEEILCCEDGALQLV